MSGESPTPHEWVPKAWEMHEECSAAALSLPLPIQIVRLPKEFLWLRSRHQRLNSKSAPANEAIAGSRRLGGAHGVGWAARESHENVRGVWHVFAGVGFGRIRNRSANSCGSYEGGVRSSAFPLDESRSGGGRRGLSRITDCHPAEDSCRRAFEDSRRSGCGGCHSKRVALDPSRKTHLSI